MPPPHFAQNCTVLANRTRGARKLTRNPKSCLSIVRGEHVLAHPSGSSSVGSHYCPVFVGDGQRGRRVADVPLSWLVFRHKRRVLRTIRPPKNYSRDVSAVPGSLPETLLHLCLSQRYFAWAGSFRKTRSCNL